MDEVSHTVDDKERSVRSLGEAHGGEPIDRELEPARALR